MKVNLKILRFDPEKDHKPHFEVYTLDVDPKDRILDLLEMVRGYHDGALAYRRSCAHGVCGSDAMRINGRNRLACKMLVQDLKTTEITVEPMLGLKVIKDLVVDMDPFFRHYRQIMPYLINDEPLPADGKERLQSPQEQERFEETTRCILCAACTPSCPSFWSNGEYVGPAAMMAAHRFIFDSRDRGAAERLQILNERSGVWACRTAFNCTEACPREIKVTQAIAEIKHAILTGRLE
jgi:succinate dehydrogenase / fumarate reductase, iron-sulfur subunit